MRQAGGGSIINISSTAGLVGAPGGTAAYTATKGAVRLFTKSTAVQHAKEGIRCNSVHPGPIATDMIKDVIEDKVKWEQRLRRLPMGRVGTPEDIAYGVIYLASDESSFMTGSELVIDGVQLRSREENNMALTLAEANRILQAAITKAQEMNIKVSAAVCDAGGRLMAFNRMDGAIWGSVYGSQGKAIASPPSDAPAAS